MSGGHLWVAMRRAVGRWRLRIWVGLAVALGLGLGRLPLFGVLGFELALAAALFSAIMGLDVGRAVARELQTMDAPGIARATWPGRTLARSTAGAAGLAIAVAAIPALISAVRGIWVPTCDWWFGIEAYLALPIATAALAGATGHAIGVLVGPRRWIGGILGVVVLLAVAAAALYRFYATPPVYTYNAILGYFPGNLYDENVRLTAALVWSRLEQLLWVIAALALLASRLDVAAFRARLRAPRPAGPRRATWATAALATAAALVLHTQAGRLGYAPDVDDFQDALGGRLETAHFVITYARTPEIEEEIDLIARDHEFRYAQVVRQVGVEPPGKIHSFVFADREQKARLFGARDVEMAKPWRREIYLEHRPFPHGSLRHEIAHAVASAFGDPIFGVSAQTVLGVPMMISPGMIEGFAVAVDWPAGYDRPSPHEAVRAMQELGRLPSVGSLFGLQFFTVSSARGYTTAGSFLRFLLDRHGPERLRTLYQTGGDFDAAYGMPRGALEAEWRAMVSEIALPPSTIKGQEERFRGGSVFSRPCPHAIAARRERAYEALGDGDRPRAVALLREVCSDAPEEPRHRMELGDLLSVGDLIERTEAELSWISIAYDRDGVTSSLRAQAYERLARLAGERGRLERARAIVGEAVELPIDPNERRTLDGMAFALAHPGPAAIALRNYFFAPGRGVPSVHHALLATIAEPQLGFGHYLLGLQRAARGEWDTAAPELALALAQGLPGPAFVKNAARRLAVAAYRTGDLHRLSVAIATLGSSSMSSGDRALAQDWFERMQLDAAAGATSR
ncbi:MAG: hypothetical protein ACTHU0_38080 [Kofleriaceae bacterium]